MAGDNKGPYRGPEQRRALRRKKSDRRDAVRWEPENEGRRAKPGRRKEDLTLRPRKKD